MSFIGAFVLCVDDLMGIGFVPLFADGGDLGDDDDEGAGDEISVDNMLAAVREQEKKDKAQIKELKAKINQLLLDVDKQTKRAETAEENYQYEKMKGAAAAKRAQDEAEGRLILDSGTFYLTVLRLKVVVC
jgi:hypothetical protein